MRTRLKRHDSTFAEIPDGVRLPVSRAAVVRPGTAIVLMTLLLALSPACRQDAQFRHEGHLTITKGACSPCHGKDSSAPRPATVSDCTGCHRKAKGLTPELAARYAAGTRGGGARRPAGYADVAFSHKRHAEAGISCGPCHVASGTTRQAVTLPGASVCVRCHAAEGGRPDDCRSCHRQGKKGRRPASHRSG